MKNELEIKQSWYRDLLLKRIRHTLKIRANDYKRAELKDDRVRMFLAEDDMRILTIYADELEQMKF